MQENKMKFLSYNMENHKEEEPRQNLFGMLTTRNYSENHFGKLRELQYFILRALC